MSFGAIGCPDREKFNPDSIIIIENNSNNDIMAYFVFRRFPDTTLVKSGSSPFLDAKQYELALIKANDINQTPDEWIARFEKDSVPIMLFLFSRDTIDQVPWEKIRDEYKILRRYDLTKELLDSLNWTITYP